MALLLQKRGQVGIVRAQCVDADRRLRLFVKCGGQGERLRPELRIEKLGHRAGQAVVDREPVQRVGKIGLGDIGGSGAAQHGVDHTCGAGFSQCPRQLDRFIHSGGSGTFMYSACASPARSTARTGASSLATGFFVN